MVSSRRRSRADLTTWSCSGCSSAVEGDRWRPPRGYTYLQTDRLREARRELSNSFTYKFEGMFRDINLSKDMSEAYAKHVRGLGATGDDQIGLMGYKP